MKLKEIHNWTEESGYKPWQVYLLAGGVFTSLGLHSEWGVVSSILRGIEGLSSGWDWLVLLGIQGVLIGFVAEYLYEQGDGYAKSASHLFGSKDRTLMFRIGAMTIVSGFITKVLPPVIRNSTEYLTIQTMGAIVALGMLLVHKGSPDWNVRTEWPAVVGGTIIAISPSVI